MRSSPVEARRDAPLELDLSGEPFDAARDLDPRHEPAVLQRQRLGDANDSAFGRVRRLENVRPIDVPAGDVELRRRCEDEAPALLRVEQRGERRRRVHVGQGEEVDRAVGGHECDRAAVADGGVRPDGREPVLAFHVLLTDQRCPK